MIIIYNIIFYILLLLSLLIYSLITVLIFIPLKKINPKLGLKIIRSGIWLGGKAILKILLRPIASTEFVNKSDWNTKKPAVIVINHISSSDAFFMGLLPFIEGTMVVKAWAFKIPFIGFIAKNAGYIKIKQRDNSQAFFQGIKTIENGTSLIVFPEGTRSNDEKLKPFYSLAFKIALQTKCPIIPMCLTGTKNFPKKGSFFLPKAHISLKAMPVISPEIYSKMDFNAYSLKRYVKKLISNELYYQKQPTIRGIVSSDNIMQYVPHRKKMLLIKEILKATKDTGTVETVINSNNIFAEKHGIINEMIFPELVAQSLAAIESCLQGKSQKGMVISFRDFNIHKNCSIGDILTIKIKKTYEFEQIIHVAGEIYAKETLLAGGTVGIWKI